MLFYRWVKLLCYCYYGGLSVGSSLYRWQFWKSTKQLMLFRQSVFRVPSDGMRLSHKVRELGLKYLSPLSYSLF